MNTVEGQRGEFIERIKLAAVNTAKEAMKYPVATSTGLVTALMTYASGFPMHIALTMAIIPAGIGQMWKHAKIANEAIDLNDATLTTLPEDRGQK